MTSIAIPSSTGQRCAQRAPQSTATTPNVRGSPIALARKLMAETRVLEHRRLGELDLWERAVGYLLGIVRIEPQQSKKNRRRALGDALSVETE